MKFKPYPKYENSGVEWLGDLPEGWRPINLKRLLSEPLMYGASEAADSDDPCNPRFIRITDIDTDGSLRSDTFKSLSMDLAAPYLLKSGDVLLARSGATVGKSFVYTDEIGPACFAGYLIRARFSAASFSHMFFSYCCQTDFYWDYISGSQIKATIQNVSAEKYANLTLPVPPLNEQFEIVDFLDRETFHIDSLISKQEALVDLLREKRRSVIASATTRGLDPTVPMKSSGLEWLGDVPEHWEIKKLKHYVTFLDDRRIPLSGEERSSMKGQFPYYGASGIIDYVNEFIFDEDLILVSEDGANLLNRSTPVSFIARGKYWVNNHAHILRPNDGINEYWADRIECENFTPFVTGAAQPKMTLDALENMCVAAPATIQERNEIVEFIRSVLPKIDALIAKAQQAIALQQEHRTALISAAVMGKIDVRTEIQERRAA